MEQRRGQAHRAASENSRRMQGAASEVSRRLHESAQNGTQMVTRLADRGTQTTAALTAANQRMLNEVMGLWMETFQLSAQMSMQMQQNALHMLRQGQAAVLRAHMTWPEALTDPVRWYQAVCRESMDGARKAFDAISGTSEAVAASVNRLQSSAERTGTNIEQALTSATSRMKRAA